MPRLGCLTNKKINKRKMLAKDVFLDGNHYRFSHFKNSKTKEIGVFLLGALQELESVDFFSKTFSTHINLFTLETPGTGMTKSLQATTSIREQALFVEKFLQAQNIKDVHLFVFSSSTAIAVELFSIHSGIKTISICGGIPGIPQSARYETTALLGDAIRSRNEFSKNFIDGLTVKELHPKSKVIARSARQKVFKYSEEQMGCFIENTLRLLTYKPSFDLKKIDIPCLLCIGENDPYVTESEARQFVSSLQNGRFVRIKGADHLTHIQEPQATAEAMLRPLMEYFSA